MATASEVGEEMFSFAIDDTAMATESTTGPSTDPLRSDEEPVGNLEHEAATPVALVPRCAASVRWRRPPTIHRSHRSRDYLSATHLYIQLIA